jgi:hypothetical protein
MIPSETASADSDRPVPLKRIAALLTEVRAGRARCGCGRRAQHVQGGLEPIATCVDCALTRRLRRDRQELTRRSTTR